MKISFSKVKWEYASEEGLNWLADFDNETAEGFLFKHSKYKKIFNVKDKVYVKEVNYRGIKSVIKFFHGGNAVREGKIALELERRGISIPNIYAFGVVRNFLSLKQDIMISEAVSSSKTLDEFLDRDFPKLSAPDKQSIIKNFSHFLRQLHDKGVLHKDLHPKNILVQDNGEIFRFVLVDLDKVVIRDKGLKWEEKAKQMGIFLSIFWISCGLIKRIRFLKYYLNNDVCPKNKKILQDIVHYAMINYRKNRKRRAKQCIRTNTEFLKQKFRDAVVYLFRSPESEYLLSSLLDNENISKGFKNNNIIKVSDFITYSKHYTIEKCPKKEGGRIAKYLSPRNRWSIIWQFPTNIMAIPTPLLCIEKRRGIFGDGLGYIFSKNIHDAIPIKDAWPVLNHTGKKRLCAKLGIIIGSLHQFGVYFGGLELDKIFIRKLNNKEKLYLSSIGRTSILNGLSEKHARKDILTLLADVKKVEDNEGYTEILLYCWMKWCGFQLNLGDDHYIKIILSNLK